MVEHRHGKAGVSSSNLDDGSILDNYVKIRVMRIRSVYPEVPRGLSKTDSAEFDIARQRTAGGAILAATGGALILVDAFTNVNYALLGMLLAAGGGTIMHFGELAMRKIRTNIDNQP